MKFLYDVKGIIEVSGAIQYQGWEKLSRLKVKEIYKNSDRHPNDAKEEQERSNRSRIDDELDRLEFDDCVKHLEKFGAIKAIGKTGIFISTSFFVDKAVNGEFFMTEDLTLLCKAQNIELVGTSKSQR